MRNGKISIFNERKLNENFASSFSRISFNENFDGNPNK